MSYFLSSTFEKMNYLGRKKVPFFFIIDFEMKNPLVLTEKELTRQENIFFSINGKSNHKNIDCKYNKKDFLISKKKIISFDKYLKCFNKVKEEFVKGNTYLLNLTFATEIEFQNNDIKLIDVYNASEADYKLYFDNKFVVFSPECFVKIRNGIISTYPMKGTIRAYFPFSKERLLRNKKELAEHVTVVDLLRNDIGMVSKKVWVNKFRYLKKITTNNGVLYATSSEICGILTEDYNSYIGDILYTLLPAGSVSGAPKQETLRIIKEVEGSPRGYYCGVFGFFDGINLDSAVMIRYIEKSEGKFYYRSGGGITIYSDPFKEYKEIKDKIYVPVCRKYLS